MYNLGDLLRNLRIEKGLSQEQLAKKIHKSDSMISDYENNYKTPPLETLKDLALFFHVSMDYLTGIEKKESIVIDGLSQTQITLLKREVNEFRDRPIVHNVGLTQTQLEIIKDMIDEFNKI